MGIDDRDPAMRPMHVHIPADEAGPLSDALADVLCWFRGFSAAKGNEEWHGPPGLEDLRDFNIKLKSFLRKIQ